MKKIFLFTLTFLVACNTIQPTDLGLVPGVHSDRMDLCEYFNEELQASYQGPHILRVFNDGVNAGNFFFEGGSQMAFVNCGDNPIKVSTSSGEEITVELSPGQVEVTSLPSSGRYNFMDEISSNDLGDWRLS